MTQGLLTVRRASLADLDALAPLFDAYRVFYELPSDPALSRGFLAARLAAGQSVVFLAEADGAALGLCQLYPSWCSLAAGRIFVLNDLYVDPAARRAGTGRALMRAAEAFGRAAGALRLELTTAHTNTRAQALYESQGWQLDRTYRTYTLDL